MKTTATTFFRCNSKGEELFAVRPDIPAGDALDMASVLLDTVDRLLSEEDSHTAFAALALVRMAKAAIDSLPVVENVGDV